jgi:hypothetical protein
MVQDRRHFQRLVLDSAPVVRFDDSRTGRLLDLSEGGLAVYGLSPASHDQIIPLSFDLPEGNGRIRAKAAVAWISDSDHRTGYRFLELGNTSRQQLKEWISARVHTTALPATGAEIEPLNHVTGAIDALINPISPEWGDKELDHQGDTLVPLHQAPGFNPQKLKLMHRQSLSHLHKLSYPIGLILALVFLAPVSFFLGYLLVGGRNHPRFIEISPVTTAAGSPTDGSNTAVTTSTPVTPTYPDSLPFDSPGFVLQVGAMAHENNADALRESLEQKNFPAFVFKRSTVRFFRVAVGPYSDADTAMRVKDELEKEGFEATIRRWSPE